MLIKILELLSILLAILVTGVFWGPWVALTRSISAFKVEVFLLIVQRLSRNIAPVMTFLMPVSLLSMLPVLIMSYSKYPETFYLTLAGFILFVIALFVTMLIEVPIVKQITTWTETTLPSNWEQIRDRWVSFHLLRIISAILGITLLLSAAIFYR